MNTDSSSGYPVTLDIDHPNRQLNRLSTFFRAFTVIPIAIVIGVITGISTGTGEAGEHTQTLVLGGTGLLFLPVLLMVLFRQKYPRWWFDWNLSLQRFGNRIAAYALLMDDHYPSTDEEQAVHLSYPYPDAKEDLGRGMPLIKWFLAIPHFVVLFFLWIGVFFAVVAAWFAILFTGRYPEGLFTFVEGVLRWHNRVMGYAFALVTDRYPPFRLAT
jgi:hypothetical protein